MKQPTDIDEDQIELFEDAKLERWEWFARSALILVPVCVMIYLLGLGISYIFG